MLCVKTILNFPVQTLFFVVSLVILTSFIHHMPNYKHMESRVYVVAAKTKDLDHPLKKRFLERFCFISGIQ